MSERQPNPEKKKNRPFDNCNSCNKDYELTPNNTVLHHYSGQDEIDNVECDCTHCGAHIRIFIDDHTFRQLVDNGVEPDCKDTYAPLDIYDRWFKLTGLEKPKTYELTNREEAVVRRFGESILAIPDDLMMDGFESEHNRPYPNRTRDA